MTKSAIAKDLVVTSDRVYIDIKKGRSKVLRALNGETSKIPVTISGYITEASTWDDGVSILFAVDIEKFKLGTPKKVSK